MFILIDGTVICFLIYTTEFTRLVDLLRQALDLNEEKPVTISSVIVYQGTAIRSTTSMFHLLIFNWIDLMLM